MDFKLEIVASGDMLKVVLHTLMSVYELRSDVAVDVLYLLCRKADPSGMVTLTSHDRIAAKLTAQQFTNALKVLKDARLISGSHSLYQIDSCVPYAASCPLTLTLQFIPA